MAYDSADGLIAAAIIVQAIVLSMVGARLISNKKKGFGFHVSDYLIVAAAVICTALAIEQAYCAAKGIFAVRVAPLLKADPVAGSEFAYLLRQHNYSFIVSGILAIGLIKISVTFFYLQIFSTPKYRPFLIVWIVIMTLWTLSFFTAFLAICGDHGLFSDRKFKDPATQAKHCGNTKMIDFGVLISGTVSDLITVLLPLPMVMTLHLRLRERLAIAAIFMIGLLSVGASTARSYIGIYTKFAPKDKIMDPGLGVTATCVWTLIEIQVGIIAACAPLIRPVLRDAVAGGIFSHIISSARSIVSRKSSRSNFSGSDHGLPEHNHNKRDGSGEVIRLHNAEGETTASAEHVHGGAEVERLKDGVGIHVSKDFDVKGDVRKN